MNKSLQFKPNNPPFYAPPRVGWPIGKLFMVAIMFLVFIPAFAQPSRVEGDWQSGSYNNNIGTLASRGAILWFRGLSSNTNAAGSLLFNNSGGSYSPKWVSYSPNSARNLNARLSGTSGSANDKARYSTNGADPNMTFSVTSGRYYTFNLATNSGTDNDMSILETSYNPVDISSATQSPTSSNVYISQPVVVTVNTASTPSSGEFVYLRYSTNAFSTSSVVAVSMAGSSGTATIPGQATGTTVQYYIFTSNQSSISTPADADYLTLNLLNASGQNAVGSNFSYTVNSAYTTAQAGNWSSTSTWVGGAVPPAGSSEVIAHNVTMDASQNVLNLTVNPSVALTTASSTTLTIASGGSITNNGTITLGTSGAVTSTASGTITNNGTFDCTTNTGTTVTFTNAGTFAGSNAVTLNNLTLTTGVLTVTKSPTVNGTFALNGGNLSAAITYGTSSTLAYGITYGQFNEWTATTDGAAGLGRPNNVTIASGTTLTLQTNVACAGSISGAGTFSPGAFIFSLRGGLSVTTFTTGTSTAIFKGTGSIASAYTFNNLTIDAGAGTVTVSAGTTQISGTYTYISGSINNVTNLRVNNAATYAYAGTTSGTITWPSFQGTTSLFSITSPVTSAITLSMGTLTAQTFNQFTVNNASAASGANDTIYVTANTSSGTTLTLGAANGYTVSGNSKVKFSGTSSSAKMILVNTVGVGNNCINLSSTSTSVFGAFAEMWFTRASTPTGGTVSSATSLIFENNSRCNMNTFTSAATPATTRATIPLANWKTGSLLDITGNGGSSIVFNDVSEPYINVNQTYWDLYFNLSGSNTYNNTNGNFCSTSGLNILGTLLVKDLNRTGNAFGLFGYPSTAIPVNTTIKIGNIIIGDNSSNNTLANIALLRCIAGQNYGSKRTHIVNITGNVTIGNNTSNSGQGRNCTFSAKGNQSGATYLGNDQELIVNVAGKTTVYGNSTFRVLAGDNNSIQSNAIYRALGGFDMVGNTTNDAAVEVCAVATGSTGPRLGALIVGDSLLGAADFNMNTPALGTGRSQLRLITNTASYTCAGVVGVLKIFGNLNNYTSVAPSSNLSIICNNNMTIGANTNSTSIIWVRKDKNGIGGNFNLQTTTSSGVSLNAPPGGQTYTNNLGIGTYIMLDGQFNPGTNSTLTAANSDSRLRASFIFTGTDPTQYAFGAAPIYSGNSNVDYQFGIKGFALPAYSLFSSSTTGNNYLVGTKAVESAITTASGSTATIGALFPFTGNNINANYKLFNGSTFTLPSTGAGSAFAISGGSTLSFGSTALTATIPSIIYTESGSTLDMSGAVHQFNILGNSEATFYINNVNGTAGQTSVVNNLSGTLSSGSGPYSTISFNSTTDGQTIPANTGYGNLDFSGVTSLKTFASSGTIGVNGNYTGNAKTGHTYTGSTIQFQGSSSGISNLLGTFNNLVVSAGTATMTTGSLTASGTVNIQSGAKLVFGSSANALSITSAGGLTWNGVIDMQNAAHTLTNTGTLTWSTGSLLTNSGGSTITFNFAGAQSIPSVTYENLTFAGSGTKTFTGPSTTIGGNFTISNTSASVTASLGTVSSASPNLLVGGNLVFTKATAGKTASLDLGSTNAHTATITGNLTVSGNNGTSNLTMSGLAHVLNLNGTTNSTVDSYTTSGGLSTVNYLGATQGLMSLTYENLNLGGSGVKQPNGAITIANSLTANGASGISIQAGNTMTINDNAVINMGNCNAANTFAFATNARVTLNYTASITTGTEASPTFNSGVFQAITVAANKTVTLGSNVTLGGVVSATNYGTLTLNSGAMLKLNTFNLNVANPTNSWYSVSSPSATNKIWINSTGSLVKTASTAQTGGLNATYPIGPDNYYNPVTISGFTVGSNGTLAISETGSKNGLVSGNALGAFWTLTGTTLGSYTANISFLYDNLQVTGTQSSYVGKYLTSGGSSWGNPAGTTSTSAAGSNPYTFNGVTTLDGTYTFGESGAFPSQFFYSRVSKYTRNPYVPAYSNNLNTWSNVSSTGAAATSLPGPSDVIIIGGSDTVTVPSGQSLVVAGTQFSSSTAFLELGTTTGNNLGTVTGNGTLQFTVSSGSPTFPSGTFTSFTAAGGGTVSYIGGATYTLPSQATYCNLKVDGGGTKTGATIDLTLNGSLSIGASSATIFSMPNSITFNTASTGFLTTNNGHASNSGNGTFNQSAGGIILAGSGTFTARGNNMNFRDITINDPAIFAMDPTAFSLSISGNLTINSNAALAFNYSNLSSPGSGANGIITSATALTFAGTTVIGGTGSGGFDVGSITIATGASVTTARDLYMHGNTLTCNGTFTQTAGTFQIGPFSGGNGQDVTFTSTGGSPNLTFYNLTQSNRNSALYIGTSFTVSNNFSDNGASSSPGGTIFKGDGGNYTVTLKNYTNTGGTGLSTATPTSSPTTHSLRILGNVTDNGSRSSLSTIVSSSLYNHVDVYFMGTTGTMTWTTSTGANVFHSLTHTQYGTDGVTPTSSVIFSQINNSSPWTPITITGNLTANSANSFSYTGNFGSFGFDNGSLGVAASITGTGTGSLKIDNLLIRGSGTVVNLGRNLNITGQGTTDNGYGMSPFEIQDGTGARYSGNYAVMPQFNCNSYTITFTKGGKIKNDPLTASTFNAGTGTIVLSPVTGQGFTINGSFTFNNLTATSSGTTYSIGPVTGAGSSYNFNGNCDFGTVSMANSGVNTFNFNGAIRTSNTNGLFGGGSTTVTNGGTATVTLGASSSIEYYSTSSQSVTGSTSYNSLIISGASNKTLGGDVTTASSLTINSGATLACGSTLRNLIVNGDLIGSSGTLSISGASHVVTLKGANNALGTLTSALANNAQVIYNSSSAQSVFGSPNYQTLTFSGGGTKTLSGAVSVAQTLNMTSGNVILGNNNITLGYAATSTSTCGSLSWTAGNLITSGTGTFTRYFPTSSLPTSAANSNLGHFPVGTATDLRHAFVSFSSATGLSVGGTITVGHADAVGDGPVNFVDASGSAQIDRQSKASWTVSSANCVLSTGTIGLGLNATNTVVVNTGQFTNVRMVRLSDGIGTHVAGTGSDAAPVVNRSFSAISQLNNTFYAGGSNTTLANVFVNAIASGNWSSNSTWDCNCTPSSVSQVTIGSPYTVTLTGAASAKTLTVSVGGTIDFGTNSLTLASGGSASVLGSVKLKNSAGLTSFAGAAFSSTNSPTVTLSSTSSVDYNGDAGSAQTITGGTYGNLTISGSRSNNIILHNGSTINIAGTFSPTATFTSGGYVNTGSTINFSGSASQTIPALSYNNLTNTGNGARTLSTSGTIGVAGTYTPSTGTLTVDNSTMNFNGTGQTIPASSYGNLTISGTTVSLTASGTYNISGSFSPNATSYTNSASTTFNFNGAGSQTIPSFNYNNLTSSSTGARTLASSGTIKVANNFTPGSNSYTVTGSTVEYNSSAAQTVTNFNYNNLVISNTRSGALTLASGAISVAGSFTVSGSTTGFTNVTTGNTFSLANSVDQTLDLTGATSPFVFNNLTVVTTSGAKVTLNGGSLQVNNTLTLTSGAVYLGNNNLTVGTSISSFGSIGGGSNIITNGTGMLFRWFGPTSPNDAGTGRWSTTISPTAFASCCSGTNSGLTNYPLGTASGGDRYVNVNPYALGAASSAAATTAIAANVTGGLIGIRYVDSTGVVPFSGNASFTELNNSVTTTIDRRTRAGWVFSVPSNISNSTIPWGIQLYNSNQKATTATTVMIVDNSGTTITGSTPSAGYSYNNAVAGTKVIPTSYLSSGNPKLYLGGNSSNLFQTFTSLTGSVNWGDASAWDVGSGTPGTNDDVVIPTGSTVLLANAASYSCRTCTLQTGGVLDMASNQLSISNSSNTIAGLYNQGTVRTQWPAGFYKNDGTSGAIKGSGNILISNQTGSTVEYYSNSAQVITPLNTAGCCGATQAYFNLTSSGSGSRCFEAATSGLNTLIINGTFNRGTNPWTTPTLSGTSVVRFSGSSQTVTAVQYDSLELGSGARTFEPNATIKLTKSISSSATLTTTNSTVEYNGTGGQTVKAISYNNVIISGTRTANSSIKLDPSSTIIINGSFTFSATLSGTGTFVTTGSTVDYANSGQQTIAPINYNILTNSGNGDRIVSGNVGIATSFSTGTGAYTVAGSTFNFNGVDGQTIPALSYFNLSSTNNTRVLGSGTINIAGTFSPGTSAYTTSGNTINFNGADGQTIPGWLYYNNLTSTNNNRTLSSNDSVKIAGTFTPGTGTWTTNGTIIDLTSASSQTIPVLTGGYDYLKVSGGGTKTLGGDITINAGGKLTLWSGTLNNASNTVAVGTGATINLVNGTFASAPTYSGTVNLNYLAARTAGNEFPTSASALNDLTINALSGNSVIINQPLATVNGTLTLKSGILDLNGNSLTINGKMGTAQAGVLNGSATSNLIISGTSASGTFGTITFGSSSANKSLASLTINRSGLQDSVELGTNLTVPTITFGATAATRLNTKSFTVDLGSTGTISGEKSASYVVGTLTTSRTVNNLTGGATETFGNTGASIVYCNNCNMGSVAVTRKSGANAVKKGNTGGFSNNTSINRTYDIVPASQPANAVFVTMTWVSADDRYATPPTTGRVFKSTDGGTTWTKMGGSFNFADRFINTRTTSFSTWTVADDASPLPLNLISFTGSVQNRVPVLNWKTAMEINNEYFEIQRSTDGNNFTSVGKVKAKGNSNSESAYTFTDYTTKYLNDGQLYYRLKAHSTTGEDEYYDVIALHLGDLAGSVNVFPNPSKGDFNLVFNKNLKADVNYTLTDNVGKVVLQGNFTDVGAGLQNRIATDGLAAGVYNLRLVVGDDVQVFKLNKE